MMVLSPTHLFRLVSLVILCIQLNRAQISSLVNVTTDVGGTAPFVCSNVATVHAFEKVWWRVNEVPLEDLNRTDVTQTLSDSGVGILTFTNVSADDDGIKVRCSGRRMITGVIVNSTDDAVLHVNEPTPPRPPPLTTLTPVPPVDNLQFELKSGIVCSSWITLDDTTFCVSTSLGTERCDIMETKFCDPMQLNIYCDAPYCINVTTMSTSGRSETVTGCYKDISGPLVNKKVFQNDSDSGAYQVILNTGICTVTVTSFLNRNTNTTVSDGWDIIYYSGSNYFYFTPPPGVSYYEVTFNISNVANSTMDTLRHGEPMEAGENPGVGIAIGVALCILAVIAIAITVVVAVYWKKRQRVITGVQQEDELRNVRIEEGAPEQDTLDVTGDFARSSTEEFRREGSADGSEGSAPYYSADENSALEEEVPPPPPPAKEEEEEEEEDPTGGDDVSEKYAPNGSIVSNKIIEMCTSGASNGVIQGSEDDVGQDAVSVGDKGSEATLAQGHIESGERPLPGSNPYSSIQVDTTVYTHKSNEGGTSDSDARQALPNLKTGRDSYPTQGIGEDSRTRGSMESALSPFH